MYMYMYIYYKKHCFPNLLQTYTFTYIHTYSKY